tara:strand:+ start:305 stop:451 length:147 start_codon:yes stop_codon:yes gene_type:complete
MVRVMPLSDYEFIWQNEDGNAWFGEIMEKSCLMMRIGAFYAIGRRMQG